MTGLIRKLLPGIIEAEVYYSDAPLSQPLSTQYAITKFTAANKSGVELIDKRLRGNTECYAVFIEGKLAHISFLFRKKLLTKQLGERNVNTAGNSLTIDAYRGRGLYTFALKQILHESERPVIIYVSKSNIASVKGIEKAGFVKKYSFRMRRFLGIKLRCSKYAGPHK